MSHTSNEYQQYMFSWRNKKQINEFWLKKRFILSYGLIVYNFSQMLSANRSGELKLSVETDMVSVSTHFQDLHNPTSMIYYIYS